MRPVERLLLGNSAVSPLPSEEPLSDHQVRELKHLLGTLSTLERMFSHAGDHRPYCPAPQSTLRVRQSI